METKILKPNNINITEEPLSKVTLCFQCKKCSGGCPVSESMDLLPHQVMRLIQLGLDEEIFKNKTIWICASCETCSTRCPNDIEIASVMDELRKLSSEKGDVSEKDIELFHKLFLGEVKMMGRVHELSLIGKHKLFTATFFKDMKMGMKMFLKNKLKLFPKWIKGRKAIKNIFKNSEKK